MSEQNAWPFPELPKEDGLNFDTIFGGGTAANDENPFVTPQVQAAPAAPPVEPAANETPAVPPVQQPVDVPPAAPVSVQQPAVSTAPPAQPVQPALTVSPAQPAATPVENPIAAAFEQKTAENAKNGLLEKPPVFQHKNVKEPIEDASMTFEELRIRKSEDFADLEEGKYVSWSVEYCGIRKDIKDPKGTTILSMKETIERSREFLDALKKAKSKDPDCIVRPKVTGKNKGVAASYKGIFRSVEDARNSDKVICLIPAGDGKIYELQKMEQGEFIAPKKKAAEFQQVRAGFTPALPPVPLSLIGQIIAFFRSFVKENEEYEAMAQIYWDKQRREFFAFIPKQTVYRDGIEADLHDCPYDDETRYICYADIHSHNRMDAFFSNTDDRDERGTGLYFVVGNLDRFLPDIKARIACGGSFVSIDPASVIEGLDRAFPETWRQYVACRKEEYGQSVSPRAAPLAKARPFSVSARRTTI